jgi:integrase
MKYKPERDLPDFAREFKMLSPSKLAEIVLNRRNKEVTSESVTMWFKRHPEVYDVLVKELVEGLPSAKEQVDTSIFQNGQFEKLESVKNWVNEMKDRDLAKSVIQYKLSALKRVCMGVFPKWKIDLAKEGLWCLKHPDRLTLDECRDLLRILKERDFDTHTIRISLRDFLTSKGFVVGKKIHGGRSRSYGKYADLKVEEKILDTMLEELKGVNYEAYLIDQVMYKTASRINATLKILLTDFDVKETHAEIKVFDKVRRSTLKSEEEIKRQGKKWLKFISLGLHNKLMSFAKENGRTEKLFLMKDDEMANLNKMLITKYCSDVLKKFPDFHEWNHFWRHMFAQINLERTGWNYSVVAFLGGWDVKSLQESYGKPPEDKLREWGLKFMPSLEASEMMSIQILEQPSLEV